MPKRSNSINEQSFPKVHRKNPDHIGQLQSELEMKMNTYTLLHFGYLQLPLLEAQLKTELKL